QIRYTVHGQVQGVNFRSFTQKQARSLGVTGFVTNASDGTVQGEAQGTEHRISDFVHYLNKGPPASSVSSVDASDMPTESGESGFHVRYT
ncbi:uncharacterized protein SETTUDRAFT_91849, partial [Exserohilum turcica Et28A]